MFGERSVVLFDGGSGLGILHVISAALFSVVLIAWARHSSRQNLVISGAASVGVFLFSYLTVVEPGDIPIDWITILHEGLGYKSILHLYAGAAHAGINFPSVLAIISGGRPTLYDVVWLNLMLAGVNAIVFFHVARYLTRPVWVVVWTLIFALNPATFLASFSELPTNLISMYLLAGVIAWGVLNDRLAQPVVVRVAAYVLCAVLTVFVALTRLEVALIGLVGLGVYTVHLVLGEERWLAARDWLVEVCERPLGFLSDHPAAVAGVSILAMIVGFTGLPWQLAGRAAMSGFNPFTPSIFSLFAFLPLLLLPIGVSIAVLCGCFHALVNFRQFGGIALSLLVILRAYFAAQDQYYEMGRYLSYVLPIVFLLGIVGNEQVEEIIRRWSPNYYRVARIAYLMAWFNLLLPGVLEHYRKPEYSFSGGLSQFLLDFNTQKEERHLLRLTGKYPDCVFVGRVVETRGAFRREPNYLYAVFGARILQPVFVPEKDVSLDEVIARHKGSAECVRLYFGGDCNLTFADHCRSFIAGRRLLEEDRYWSRIYNNPIDYGYVESELVLATYAWP